jgi:Domain of unknown function (DUF4136)
MTALLRCTILTGVCVLSACTTVTTYVTANRTSTEITATGSYAFASLPTGVQASAPQEEQYESLLDARLKRLGLTKRGPDHARYLLSIAYDTRLARVEVVDDHYKATHCNIADQSTPFLHFGRRWEHSLTLRFFDAASGSEMYRVIAGRRDGETDARHIAPYLAMSALAEVPFTTDGTFRIKLRAARNDIEPKVMSVDVKSACTK